MISKCCKKSIYLKSTEYSVYYVCVHCHRPCDETIKYQGDIYHDADFLTPKFESENT